MIDMASPETIAATFDGNKQKILQAAQMGTIDPTSAVLAGMFIDRMRNAQVMEQAPQSTVAQKVMGGLGSLPSQTSLPQQTSQPMPQAPQQMAEGGIIGIDIPDTMYDEPSNGGFDDGYAGGGLVAFAKGGSANPQSLTWASQPNTDKWALLAQLGFNLASTKSPYFLQALGDAGRDVLPQIQAQQQQQRQQRLLAQRNDLVRRAAQGDKDALAQLAPLDLDAYKAVEQSGQTAFQKDFQFIKDQFGDKAAAEYAQYGRGDNVSIPLGDGRTYVGPAAGAPGATPWEGAAPVTVPDILKQASSSGRMTQSDVAMVKGNLGPAGQAQFDAWLKDKSIKVISRTGTTPDGRKVVQFSDGTVDYAN